MLLLTALLAPHVQGQQCNTDVLFLLDASGSVSNAFRSMVKYIVGVANALTIGPGLHRVAILEYSSQERATKWPRIHFDEIKNTSEFVERVQNLPYLRGTTDSGLALKIAADELLPSRRPTGLTVVYVVTDGYYRDDDRVRLQSAEYQRMPNTKVFCAAVPDKFNYHGMQNITRDEENIIAGGNILQKSLDILLPLIGCMRPETTTELTTTTPRVTGCELDLLFMMDFSGSVDNVQRRYVEMASEIVRDLKIDPYFTRVAMVKYSGRDRAEAVFHLKKHSTTDGILAEMNATEYLSGSTWTGSALRYSMDEFSVQNGARPELAKKVVVVFTDGYSQEDPAEAAAAMRATGVIMFAVAIEEDDFPPNMDQLRTIADNEQQVFTTRTFDGLRNRIRQFNENCRS
uniref:VWFA domain-containing protein n=1 Tax=Plectus sambesii TaxID=2011161 RepID=A0A914WZI9_9BILA